MLPYIFLLLTVLSYAANIPIPNVDRGSSTLVPDRTVHAAIILSDGKSVSASLHARNEHFKHFTNFTQIELDVVTILESRSKNRDPLTSPFGFEVFKWPMINSHPCPHYPHSDHNRLERGFGLSHMQIWLEFLFFDNDVIDAMHRKNPEYITSNSYSSVSGIFTAVQNNSLYRNGIPYLEDDIMVVMEDTAVWIPFTSNSIEDKHTEEVSPMQRLGSALENMASDILSLGTGRSTIPAHALAHLRAHSADHAQVSLSSTLDDTPESNTNSDNNTKTNTNSVLFTSNAYAITRRGARKLASYYDHCGAPLEDQIAVFLEAGMISLEQLPPDDALFDTIVDPL